MTSDIPSGEVFRSQHDLIYEAIQSVPGLQYIPDREIYERRWQRDDMDAYYKLAAAEPVFDIVALNALAEELRGHLDIEWDSFELARYLERPGQSEGELTIPLLAICEQLGTSVVRKTVTINPGFKDFPSGATTRESEREIKLTTRLGIYPTRRLAKMDIEKGSTMYIYEGKNRRQLRRSQKAFSKRQKPGVLRNRGQILE